MPSEQQYWELIRETVCRKCIDGDGQAGCRLSRDRECAVKHYLPQIIDVVNSTYSTAIGPYEDQLRSKVCGVCVHQSKHGECSIRDDVECALDRYFPLIVQAIEGGQLRERFKTGERSA